MATRKKKPAARVEMPRRSANEVRRGGRSTAADSILTMDYYNDVRGVARDLAQRMKDGEIEDFSDALHETVDGTLRVTYTWQSQVRAARERKRRRLRR